MRTMPSTRRSRTSRYPSNASRTTRTCAGRCSESVACSCATCSRMAAGSRIARADGAGGVAQYAEGARQSHTARGFWVLSEFEHVVAAVLGPDALNCAFEMCLRLVEL